MPKNYVLAIEQTYLGKDLYKEGEIVGTYNADSIGAQNKAHDMNRRVDRYKVHFAAIQCEESYKKGEICPTLLEQWKQNDFDRQATYLMKNILKPVTTGDDFNEVRISVELARLNLSLEDLHARYETRAQAELDQKQRHTQELAELNARKQAVKKDLGKIRSEITYSFPAVRGIQATREFYVAQIPFGILTRLFVFDEEVVPAEYRAQRVLNPRRAQDISDYMVANPTDYVLPALTASVSAEMAFEPVSLPGASDRVGMLHIPIEAVMLINDGQHRRKAIELALAQNPALKEETVAITIYFDRGLEKSQQMFADINAKQVKPSSTISALYDRRNPFNSWVMSLLEHLPEIKRRIDFENPAPGMKSSKLWSLVAFKKFITHLTGYTEKNIEDLDQDMRERICVIIKRFFTECHTHIPQWASMMDNRVMASEVREQWVIGHAVWLEGLGMFGRQLIERATDTDSVNWGLMGRLSLVDPMKTSLQWENRCVVLGKMQKTADGVKSTAAQLMRMANIPLPSELILVNNRVEASHQTRMANQ